MNHTPGPWQVYTGHDGQFKDTPYILDTEPRKADQPSVAIARVMDNRWDVTMANARLIAAAPDLLKVLSNLVAAHEAEITPPYNSDEWDAARQVVAELDDK